MTQGDVHYPCQQLPKQMGIRRLAAPRSTSQQHGASGCQPPGRQRGRREFGAAGGNLGQQETRLLPASSSSASAPRAASGLLLADLGSSAQCNPLIPSTKHFSPLPKYQNFSYFPSLQSSSTVLQRFSSQGEELEALPAPNSFAAARALRLLPAQRRAPEPPMQRSCKHLPVTEKLFGFLSGE